MKITGLILVFVGIVAFLKNTGIIFEFDWSIIWPLLLIVAGIIVKHLGSCHGCYKNASCESCKNGTCTTNCKK